MCFQRRLLDPVRRIIPHEKISNGNAVPYSDKVGEVSARKGKPRLSKYIGLFRLIAIPRGIV